MGRPFGKLLTDAQLSDQSTVTVDVLLCQVVQHGTALTNHHQQTTAGVVVVLVGTQVLGQLVDASGQDSDLDLGRTGVALVGSVSQDNFSLLSLLNHCVFHLFIIFPVSQVKGGWCTEIQLSPKTEQRV